jgi:hypothetical protein
MTNGWVGPVANAPVVRSDASAKRRETEGYFFARNNFSISESLIVS